MQESPSLYMKFRRNEVTLEGQVLESWKVSFYPTTPSPEVSKVQNRIAPR